MPVVFVTGGSGFVGRHLIPALRAEGYTVRALARSAQAVETVRALEAEPVPGDVGDVAALERGMAGCEAVFHLAAVMDHSQGREALERVNVGGTENALAAAREAGVRRFVYVSTAAVLAGSASLVGVDESRGLPAKPVGLYPRTKIQAEERVLAARAPGFEAVIVRPSFVWGRGDTANLPQLVDSARKKQFSWIDEGRFRFSTCHVRNLCEGLVRAAQRGQDGAVYYLSDGEPVELRDFLTELLRTQGVEPGERSASRGMVLAVCSLVELPWRLLPLKSAPPDHLRMVTELLGQENTVVDARARRELGYTAAISREQGLAEMRARS